MGELSPEGTILPVTATGTATHVVMISPGTEIGLHVGGREEGSDLSQAEAAGMAAQQLLGEGGPAVLETTDVKKLHRQRPTRGNAGMLTPSLCLEPSGQRRRGVRAAALPGPDGRSGLSCALPLARAPACMSPRMRARAHSPTPNTAWSPSSCPARPSRSARSKNASSVSPP